MHGSNVLRGRRQATASHRRFPEGKTATAMFSLELGACNSSTVFGTAGRIVVPDSHAPSRVSLVEVPRIRARPLVPCCLDKAQSCHVTTRSDQRLLDM